MKDFKVQEPMDIIPSFGGECTYQAINDCWYFWGSISFIPVTLLVLFVAAKIIIKKKSKKKSSQD